MPLPLNTIQSIKINRLSKKPSRSITRTINLLEHRRKNPLNLYKFRMKRSQRGKRMVRPEETVTEPPRIRGETIREGRERPRRSIGEQERGARKAETKMRAGVTAAGLLSIKMTNYPANKPAGAAKTPGNTGGGFRGLALTPLAPRLPEED